MIDHRERPRVTLRERDSGFDVWLPALVAIIAAIFMLTAAHAQDAGANAGWDAPRALYDTGRFAPDAIAREAAEAQAARNAATYTAARASYVAADVTVAALPDLTAAPAVASRIAPAVDRSVVIRADEAPSLGRFVAAGLIAALLLAALVALAKTWRRTDPLAV